MRRVLDGLPREANVLEIKRLSDTNLGKKKYTMKNIA
jgi:hypothetical protein